MELIILSTVAAAAILLAELRDLARREWIDRLTVSAGPPRVAVVAEFTPGSSAANLGPNAPCPELDRAA
jgi:hypothetical protein